MRDGRVISIAPTAWPRSMWGRAGQGARRTSGRHQICVFCVHLVCTNVHQCALFFYRHGRTGGFRCFATTFDQLPCCALRLRHTAVYWKPSASRINEAARLKLQTVVARHTEELTTWTPVAVPTLLVGTGVGSLGTSMNKTPNNGDNDGSTHGSDRCRRRRHAI